MNSIYFFVKSTRCRKSWLSIAKKYLKALNETTSKVRLYFKLQKQAFILLQSSNNYLLMDKKTHITTNTVILKF